MVGTIQCMFMLYCNMSLHFIVMYVALLLQHDIICLKFVDNSNFISLYLNKKYKGEKIKFSTTQPYQYQDNNISQQLSYSPTFFKKNSSFSFAFLGTSYIMENISKVLYSKKNSDLIFHGKVS